MGRASVCALSGLPIESGDAMVIILLVCANVGTGGDAAWLPACAPIHATYDEDARIGAISTKDNAAAELCARAFGAKSVGELGKLVNRGQIAEPKVAKEYGPDWREQGLSLARKDAFLALVSLPLSAREGGGHRLGEESFESTRALAVAEPPAACASISRAMKASAGAIKELEATLPPGDEEALGDLNYAIEQARAKGYKMAGACPGLDGVFGEEAMSGRGGRGGRALESKAEALVLAKLPQLG